MLNLLPLLRKELVVIARRRRTFFMRAGTLALLTLLMIPLLVQLVIQSGRGYSVKGVAEVLFQIFVWTQFGLLVMGAPAFSAGAISYERRLGTIDLLKLAAIRAPTLTFGKFLGAAALPFLLVLSEVPFLFVWTLFGGIAPEVILAALLLSAAITVLLIAIGLFTSAVTETAGVAMVLSYALTLAYLFLPLWGKPFFPRGFGDWTLHVALAKVLNGSGLVLFPWWKAAGSSLAASIALAVGASVFLVQPPSLSRLLDRTSIGSGANRKSRRVWSHPILWREITCGGGPRVTAFINLITAVSVACFAAAALVKSDDWRGVLGGITIALPIITGGVLGSIGISLEKEGRSIAALLLIPTASLSVVLGKFAGACSRALPLTIVPFLLGFVRLDPWWMWGAAVSVLMTFILIATGVLFSTVFARSAVAVAVNFAATVLYTFCCFCNIGMFPMFLLMPLQPGDDGMRVVILAFTIAIYGVIVATVLAVAIGLFEQRAREAV